MRILHVVDSLDPRLGGPPVVVARLAAAQAALGHDVLLLSYGSPGAEDEIARVFETIPHGGSVARHSLVEISVTGGLFSGRARRATKPLIEVADFVHLHGVWPPILLSVAKGSRRSDVPYVVAPHGMLSPWALSQKKVKKAVGLALAHRRMLDGAAFIHVLNRSEHQLAAELNLRAPFEIIPNGASVENPDDWPESGTFRKAHPEVEADPFILYLGRLHPLKGLDLLTEAFSLIRDDVSNLRLVVVGPDAGAETALREQVHRLGITDRVHIVGPQYGRDKQAALRDAMCFCLASEHEAFSVAIAEAMSFELPVVVTKQCNFPEVAEAGAGEIVGLDHREIADALRRIATDPGLRLRMGAAGRALVEQQFTWPRVAERTTTAYEMVLAARGR